MPRRGLHVISNGADGDGTAINGGERPGLFGTATHESQGPANQGNGCIDFHVDIRLRQGLRCCLREALGDVEHAKLRGLEGAEK